MQIFGRVVRVLLFGGLAALAVSLTRENIRNADVPEFAQEVQKSAGIDPEFFKSHLALVDSVGTLHSCRTDKLRPLLEVRMNELDFYFGHEEIAKSQKRLSNSATFLTQFLTCVPTDGIVLALDALVIKTIQQNDPRLNDMLALSQVYLPAQLRAVEVRAGMLMGMPWQNDKNLETLLDRDLRLMTFYFVPKDLKRFISRAPDEIRRMIKDLVSQATLDRQIDLMDEL